jgi:hypothetical protein
MATPSANVVCPTVLSTPEPVAYADAGNAIPSTMMPAIAAVMFGSSPSTTGNHAMPTPNSMAPDPAAAAEPIRSITRRASRSDVTGTTNGPGAIACGALRLLGTSGGSAHSVEGVAVQSNELLHSHRRLAGDFGDYLVFAREDAVLIIERDGAEMLDQELHPAVIF